MADGAGSLPAIVRQTDRVARFIFRGGAPAAEPAAAVLGFAVPDQPCRSSRSGLRAALWLGPDEWLLLVPIDERDRFASDMAGGLAHIPHALVDVTAGYRGVLVTGPGAEDALAAGCPLDLDPALFPVGMCTRTLFGKSSVVLWRMGAAEFHLEVARSFAPYVITLLEQAVRDAK